MRESQASPSFSTHIQLKECYSRNAAKLTSLPLLQTAKMLSHPRVTDEIKQIWVGFLAQMDTQLGAAVAGKLRMPKPADNGAATRV